MSNTAIVLFLIATSYLSSSLSQVDPAGEIPTVAEIHEAAAQRQSRIRSVDVEYHAKFTRLAETPSTERKLQAKYRMHFKTDGRS